MRNLQKVSTLALVAAILSFTVQWAGAQNESRFSAASLKAVAPPVSRPAPPGEEIISERVVSSAAGVPVNPGVVNPGRMHFVGTLREFLANAYDVKEIQIEGPAWMNTERFVLDATMPPETTREQRLVMLQNLLADRFQLRSHHEEKELPMYSLVMGKNGLKVEESAALVTEVRTVAGTGRVRIAGQATTMQDLASHLTRQLDRPVRDETGRKERYDFVLTFSLEGLSGPLPSGLPDARDLPDLFGALQSQLGLRLEARKGPVELIVIDHIERTPAGN